MAICNRDFDVSEQKQVIRGVFAATEAASAATSFIIGCVPTPCNLQAVKVAVQGLSGAPVGFIEVQRFIAGTGFTQITGIGATLLLSAMSTSGMLGVSLAASGSTLLALQAQDVLVWRHGFVGNTAAREVAVECVVKRLQDIVALYGSST